MAETAAAADITAESIRAKLEEALEAAHVEITDTSGGCGQMFEAVIVSSQFEGKGLLQRHRLVNETLAEELKTIHAFSQVSAESVVATVAKLPHLRLLAATDIVLPAGCVDLVRESHPGLLVDLET